MANKLSQVLNIERVQKLDAWMKATNTKLTQVNGQRKYGGPPEEWEGPTPGDRCEVFISQIPRDAFEDLLIPLFSSVGPLWEFRLMMNFSGQNRGFAYAKYSSPAFASTAIRQLHGHMLEPGQRLSVRHSTEKRQLCVGDLPTSTKREHLLQVLRILTEGVERVSLKTGPGIEGVSAIVVFSSHHSASMAKKVLVEAFKKHFALTVSVKWQSTVKPNAEEPPSPPKQDKGLLPSPRTQPRHILGSPPHNPPPQPSAHPPRLARPPSLPPDFCRAVGGPTTPRNPPSCSTISSSQESVGSGVPSSSPVTLLRQMCEGAGFGKPLYELLHCHTGPDGLLHCTFKVSIPGVGVAFEEVAMILPGPTDPLEEARRAAAQQIFLRLPYFQLSL